MQPVCHRTSVFKRRQYARCGTFQEIMERRGIHFSARERELYHQARVDVGNISS